jgi:hypothetical protein
VSEFWFRHNARSRGPGLPIHTNGWILLGAWVSYMLLYPFAFEYAYGTPPNLIARAILIAVVTIPALMLARRKTAPPTPEATPPPPKPED